MMAIDVVVNQRHLQIQLKQLETVWHTVINGYNLSQAATVLHTSQSSLSKHIAALENQLKTQVFVRQGKRLTGLTTMGTALMPHIESIFAEIRTIENLSLDFNNPNIGTLTIATTHTQARYVLPPVVAAFKKLFPKVHLVLHQAAPTEITTMLQDGLADIGIATEALASNNNLARFPFHSWTHSVIVPQGHPLESMPFVRLEDIAAYPIITYYKGITGRARIDEAFSKAGVTPDIVMSALDSDVIKTYVELGLGIGIVASVAFNPQRDMGLHLLDCSRLFSPNTTLIAVRRGHYLRGYAYRFIELCASNLTEHVVRAALQSEAEAEDCPLM